MSPTSRSVRSLLILLGLIGVGCFVRSGARHEATIEQDGAVLSISGPYSHLNLTVFLVHSEQQHPETFITLDEGLDSGLVQVTEGREARVNVLEIENRSDCPLFLHEGDRLQGGKQDRTIYASLVVPAHSGKIPLPTFCIEQSRWTAGIDGNKFKNVGNQALAPKPVRTAAKIHGSQPDVWAAVSSVKVRFATHMLAENTNSSLNQALDAPQAKQISEDFTNALGSLMATHTTAVGVAIAINGVIEEVDIYPNHSLLAKLFPRLLQSYALQAALENDKPVRRVCTQDVAAFMMHGDQTASRSQQLNQRNRMQLVEMDDKTVDCSTTYDGVVIHRQRLSDAALLGRVNTAQAPNLENDEIGLDPSINYNVERIEDVSVPAPHETPMAKGQK